MSITDEQVGTRLLQYLRAELRNTSIQYLLTPTRIVGGQTTRLYRFQLTPEITELSQPLVLRLYPPWLTDSAFFEGQVQNTLSQMKYPVPRAFFTCSDQSIVGSDFLIMEYMPGETMWNAMSLDQIPIQLATAQAELHQLDPRPLTTTLHDHDMQRNFKAMITTLRQRIETHNITWLRPALQWIIDHQPATKDGIVICHNDFHPNNILVNHGQISAVLDWSTVMFVDPECDVANTISRIRQFNPILRPWISPAATNQMVTRYYEQYTQRNALDPEKLLYYEAVINIALLTRIAQGAFAHYADRLKDVNIQRLQQITHLTLHHGT